MSVSDSAREVLKRYGLSEYESKAYATLVELGSASVRELCKVAAIPQPRAYDTLAKLESKGLVETQDGRPMIYRAVPPKDAFERLEKGLKAQTAMAVEEFASRYGYERSNAEMWTIKGQVNIINKIEEMLNGVQEELLLALPTAVLEKVKPPLDKAVGRNVKTRLMLSQRGNPQVPIPKIDESINFTRKDDIPSILVVVDGKEALLSSGCTNNYQGPWVSIWTNEPSFIELLSLFFESH
ncbi:MAG: TrmB family transcriptional regulator [Promethearchaeati archaeon SRVP18_Atabeyarchaeia-1]